MLFRSVIGDIVKNAVPINALNNKAKGVTGTYAMAAYVTDSRRREFVAIVTAEQINGNIAGVEVYDVAHAVSGRQKNSSQADTKSQRVYSIKAAKISISDLLQIVNSTHQSILSEDVLQKFGEQRNPQGGLYREGQILVSGRAVSGSDGGEGGEVHQRNTMRISQNKEIPFQNWRGISLSMHDHPNYTVQKNNALG